ncbi:MAG: hypothetical protein IBX56_04585 [Methylomicrobium sp.]|nr:hypothetical protein [Methylomicrobium sp.]
MKQNKQRLSARLKAQFEESARLEKAIKDLVVNNFPILGRVRLLDWQVSAAGKAAVKPTRTYSRRPAKRVTEPSTKRIVPGRYLLRNPKDNLAGIGYDL